MHNSQLVSNKVRYIELLGQDEAKRTSREIGNIFVPVLKRNGITQKRPPVKQGRQNFMNICKMYCASAHFSILLFSNQLFPQTGSTSVRQRSLTYFSFTAKTSNLAWVLRMNWGQNGSWERDFFLVKSKMRFAVLCIFVYFNSFSRILIICNGGDREALQILRNTAVLPEKFFCKQSPRFLLSFTTVFPTPCIHRSTHSPLPVIRGWSAHMGGLYLWLWRKISYLKLC